MSETSYIILQRHVGGADVAAPEDGSQWLVAGTVTASDAGAAVLAVARERLRGSDSKTFVAVPARSWKPVTIKSEQTIVLKVEEAS